MTVSIHCHCKRCKPACASTDIVKKGTKGGRQRYLCNECGHIFIISRRVPEQNKPRRDDVPEGKKCDFVNNKTGDLCNELAIRDASKLGIVSYKFVCKKHFKYLGQWVNKQKKLPMNHREVATQ